jgi:hypothetical protein
MPDCKKCGSFHHDKFIITFHSHKNGAGGYNHDEIMRYTLKFKDCLIVTCHRCGFEWVEPCKDDKEII